TSPNRNYVLMSGRRILAAFTVASVLIPALSAKWFRCSGAEQERATPQSTTPRALQERRADAMTWFSKGQTTLQNGDLDAAEAAFRKVIALDPRSGAAYSNLGVVAMRRKDWDHAIKLLQTAQKLDPRMAGIRMNIGLVEYRRGNYRAAIAPFESVVRDEPGSQ